MGVIDWESTTVEYQFGKSKSDKQIPDTTKEDLQSAREELDRMMQEAEVLRTNQHLEIRVREEIQWLRRNRRSTKSS